MKSIYLAFLSFIFILYALLGLTGCQSGYGNSVALNVDDQAAAEQILYPRFDLAHAAPFEPEPELEQKLNEILVRLETVQEADVAPGLFSLFVTAEPDADAGCIAGGRLFVSKGLLAWIENGDELAGVVAVAMQQCSRASRLWRERDALELVEFDEQSELMKRYIDYRLNSNASLFNQAVASGCVNADCFERVQEQLNGAGFEPQALLGLYARIQQAWPQAAWLERTGLQVQDWLASPVSADPEWLRLLTQHQSMREGYKDFAEVRRQISRGDLHPAYQASLRARQILGRTFEAELMQAELDLHNLHPNYSERILHRIEAEFGEITHADYYWGWTNAQLKRRDIAREQLQKSIEILPKVSAHHFLGQQWILANENELAIVQLGHVLEAGPQHPNAADAELFLGIAQQRL